MTESHPIPAIAVTANALLEQQYEKALQAMARQTLDVLGLVGDGWHVDYRRGVVTRDVPDIAPEG